jgi:hypothetical protein
VPLSFLWDGATLLIATPAASPTSRNLQATGKVRLGVGPSPCARGYPQAVDNSCE